jgi:hypothetical protein
MKLVKWSNLYVERYENMLNWIAEDFGYQEFIIEMQEVSNTQACCRGTEPGTAWGSLGTDFKFSQCTFEIFTRFVMDNMSFRLNHCVSFLPIHN